MTEFIARRDPNRCPSHPGAVLEDMIPSTGMTKAAIAETLGISRQQLHDILREAKPVSPRIAARISRAFGGSTASWLNIQSAYDAWNVERELADEIENILPIRTAVSRPASPKRSVPRVANPALPAAGRPGTKKTASRGGRG